jgi:hypothetical protein
VPSFAFASTSMLFWQSSFCHSLNMAVPCVLVLFDLFYNCFLLSNLFSYSYISNSIFSKFSITSQNVRCFIVEAKRRWNKCKDIVHWYSLLLLYYFLLANKPILQNNELVGHKTSPYLCILRIHCHINVWKYETLDFVINLFQIFIFKLWVKFKNYTQVNSKISYSITV